MQVRIDKLEDHYKEGIDHFGEKFVRTHKAKELVELYDEFDKEELAEKLIETTVAGRMMTKRGKGKVGFAHIQDASGQIKLYVRKDEIGEEAYELYKTLDIGDILGVSGVIYITKSGAHSINVKEYTLFDKLISTETHI